jgi:dihydrofolate reductase
MIISLIVAMDENRGIGYQNRLPWRLSADMKHFKSITMGHHLVMGRKTFQSIGRALSGRTMIVLSRQAGYASVLPEGCLTARSLEEALDLARERGETEVFVIGGAEVYRSALPLADRIYLTRVYATVPADVHFPEIRQEDWAPGEVRLFGADEQNQHPFSMVVLERARVM